MAAGGSSSGDVPHLSEFRVVLLGNRKAGKSSSGNTILGREEIVLKRRTAQCVKRQGEVAGRQVTVVEAPGWWWNVHLKDTPKLTKQEIVLSVSLCPPGPNAVLLVIEMDSSISKDLGRILQEHIELLGESVWSNTMVLFTSGDWLGDATIEQYIESEKALQSLIEKCGNRYHVFNNENKGDDTQVTQLFEKIEEMVEGNRGHHFEMDRTRLEETQEKRIKEEERAKERLMKVEKQRQHLQSLKSKSPPLSEFRVVLLGNREAGKSSSGNTILGREEFDLKRRTAQCVKRQGEVAGRQVTVVEAPGWWRNINLKDTPELTKQEIVLSVSLCPPGPHAALLVIRVDVSISKDKSRILQEHLEFLSESVWSHTIVLFTRGDWLGDTTIEQYIESEGALQSLVEKCGNRYHVLNNLNNTDDQVLLLLEKIEEMVAGNSYLHYEMDRKRLEEMEESRKQQRQRADDREMYVYRQKKALAYSVGGVPHLAEVRIVLLGYNDAGKSSSGNTILGREEFDTAGRTAQCVKRQGEVAGRQVTVVEAPGWSKNINLKDTPEHTKHQIVHSVSLCPPGPDVILLILGVDESISELHRKNIEEHLRLVGERVWSHTMVLFTRGDWLGDTTIEQHIECEGESLIWLIEKCGHRYHVLNNKNKGDDSQVTELLQKIEGMVVRNRGLPIWNGGETQDREMDETAARLGGLDLQESKSWPLNMSGDDGSERFTEESSGYGTPTSERSYHGQDRQDVLGQRDAHTFSVDEDEDEDGYESDYCEAPGPSVAVLSDMSIPQKSERGHLGGQLPEKKGEVEDMCSAEDRKWNGDVEVFTPAIIYSFSCSSAGVYKCGYTGQVFKMGTAAEVQYDSLMAAGPLFKMKVSQLGSPHCEIISKSRTSSPLTPPGQNFFQRHKAALEKRLGLLTPILSDLEECKVLNAQEREVVEKSPETKQNRALLLMLEKKGVKAQEEFCKVLAKCDEYLVEDLERPHN